MIGKSTSGNDLEKTESYLVNKGVGPKFVEISLAANDISIKER